MNADKGESVHSLKVDPMIIGPISAGTLGQEILSSSESNQLQQIVQTLQTSLTNGDLNSAQSAFQSLQKLSQGLEKASGSSNSQFSTDLAALGSALNSGDLATANSAFATLQKDLKSNSSPSIANELNTATQAQQLVEGVLSSLTTSNSGTTSLLENVYGTKGSLNVLA